MNTNTEKKLSKYTKWSAVGVGLSMVAAPAFAVVPTYITDALTSAQTTFTDYLTASAPAVFGMTVILAAFFLVVRLIKKATH